MNWVDSFIKMIIRWAVGDVEIQSSKYTYVRSENTDLDTLEKLDEDC
jgi:hypothetical protein